MAKQLKEKANVGTRKIAALTASIRTELEAMYQQRFGCAWDVSPFGPSWGELARDARRADERYFAAERALLGIAKAIQAGVDLIGREVLDSPVPDVSPTVAALAAPIIAGRPAFTEPEAMLYEALTDRGGCLRRVLDNVVNAWAKHEASFLNANRRDGSIYDRFAAVDELKSVLPPEVVCGLWSEDRSNSNLTRRMMLFDDGPASDHQVGPGLPSPPPRTTDGDEWVRGFLVEVFDQRGVHPRVSHTADRFASDSEVAIVSLLMLLEGLNPKKLRLKFSDLLAGERRAIAKARGRRAYIYPRLKNERLQREIERRQREIERQEQELLDSTISPDDPRHSNARNRAVREWLLAQWGTDPSTDIPKTS